MTVTEIETMAVQDSSDAEDMKSPRSDTTKKRKRDTNTEDELEIDVNLPEPPSKKALRRAKKGKPAKSAPLKEELTDDEDDENGDTKSQTKAQNATKPSKDGKFKTGRAKQTDFGVWIGNLPFGATPETLRTWLIEGANLEVNEIARVNMPAPTAAAPYRNGMKPLNKGFAYVDFNTREAASAVIALSDTNMHGRKVLIKDSENFEGRPEKDSAAGTTEQKLWGDKPPSHRVFVGNLSFETTEDNLRYLYGRCGEITNVHMATFEDSGKSKGFAWVTFADIEAATAAVKGYTFVSIEQDVADEEQTPESADKVEVDQEGMNPERKVMLKREKKGPKRRWWVNKLNGRTLRCEFAEDAAVRYNKRFGKKQADDSNGEGSNDAISNGSKQQNDDGKDALGRDKRPTEPRPGHFEPLKRHASGQRQSRKVDARSIRPGAANAKAARATAAIPVTSGKKTTFE